MIISKWKAVFLGNAWSDHFIIYYYLFSFDVKSNSFKSQLMILRRIFLISRHPLFSQALINRHRQTKNIIMDLEKEWYTSLESEFVLHIGDTG